MHMAMRSTCTIYWQGEIVCAKVDGFDKHIELPAKLLDYFLRSNKNKINLMKRMPHTTHDVHHHNSKMLFWCDLHNKITWSSKNPRDNNYENSPRVKQNTCLPRTYLEGGKKNWMCQSISDLVLYVVEKGLSQDTNSDLVIDIEPKSKGWKFSNSNLEMHSTFEMMDTKHKLFSCDHECDFKLYLHIKLATSRWIVMWNWTIRCERNLF